MVHQLQDVHLVGSICCTLRTCRSKCTYVRWCHPCDTEFWVFPVPQSHRGHYLSSMHGHTASARDLRVLICTCPRGPNHVCTKLTCDFKGHSGYEIGLRKLWAHSFGNEVKKIFVLLHFFLIAALLFLIRKLRWLLSNVPRDHFPAHGS